MAKLIGGTQIYGTATILGTTFVGGIVNTSTIATNSTGSGAIIVTGGVGVGGGLFVGGTVTASNVVINGYQVSTATIFNGGTITNPLIINNSTTSVSSQTGALVVNGGTGIQGNLNVGGITSVTNLAVNGSVIAPLTLNYGVFGVADIAPTSGLINVTAGTSATYAIITNPGTYYNATPTVVISVPTTVGGSVATGAAYLGIQTVPTIVNGGGSYSVGDVLTFTLGTFTTPASVKVTTTTTSGVITGISINATGSYSALPSNPISVTGGTGAGATFSANFGVSTIAFSGGSGYVEQPTVTLVGGTTGTTATVYGYIGQQASIKTLGNALNFYTPAGLGFSVVDPAVTSVNYVSAWGGNGAAFLKVQGAGNSDLVLDSLGTSSAIQFRPNSVRQFNVSYTANSVNYFNATGAATGTGPSLIATGADANINPQFITQGTGSFIFRSNGTGGNELFEINPGSGAVANGIRIYGSTAGNNPIIQPVGSDPNLDLVITGRGTGQTQFQSPTGGYIQFRVTQTANAVNYLNVTGNTTGNTPVLSAQGSDSAIGVIVTSKGAGAITFKTQGNGYTQFRIADATSANYLQVQGAASGSGPILTSQGTDANVNLVLQVQGTATINLTTGTIINGVTTVTSLVNASSTITGALQVAGGIGIGGGIYVGGTSTFLSNVGINNSNPLYNLDVFGTGNISGGLVISNSSGFPPAYTAPAADTVNNSNGQLVIGGVGPANSISFGTTNATKNGWTERIRFNTSATQGAAGIIIYEPTTFTNTIIVNGNVASASSTTGAVVVTGGVGIGGNLNVGGAITANTVTAQTLIIAYTTVTQTLVTSPDIFTITNTTQSLSTTSGALTVAGGVGIGGNLFVGGYITATNISLGGFAVVTATFNGGTITNPLVINNFTTASSTNTGALQVYGGAGIGGNLFVGSNTNVSGAVVAQIVSLQGGNNLFLQSAGLNVTANWPQTGVTVTSSQPDPFGGTTAILMNDGSGTSTHLIQQSVTYSYGQTYTFSVYAKANTTNYIFLFGAGLGGNGTNGQGVIFNISNGTFASYYSGSNCPYTITNAGNGWYRCSITGAYTNSPYQFYGIYMSENGTSYNYTGTNLSIYVAAPQLELGTYTSPYAPTTSAAVTTNNNLYLPNGSAIIGGISASTSTTTGALQVAGGVGIGGSLYVGNRVGFVNSITNASAVYQVYNTVIGSFDTVFG